MMKRILLMIFAAAALLAAGCGNGGEAGKSPEEVLFWDFHERMAAGDFQGLYELLSTEAQSRISEEDFMARYTNIVAGLFSEIQWTIVEEGEEAELAEGTRRIPFSVSMETLAGPVERDGFEFLAVEENRDGEALFLVDWFDSLIYPELERDDSVAVRGPWNDGSMRGRRGSILAGDGTLLASDGALVQVGLWPAFFDESFIGPLAQVLDISEGTIRTPLEGANPDHLVPVVNLLPDSPLIGQLESLRDEKDNSAGIRLTEVPGRVYYDHEAFGRLVGYIGAIHAEELEADEDGVYHANSVIGRMGLEQQYETRLRAVDGMEIWIRKGEEHGATIALREPIHGEDVQLAIDPVLQVAVYEAMGGLAGSAAGVDPHTGKILALVSSPSFNANRFTTYITLTDAALWEARGVGAANVPNRFASAYSPGSTFKLQTAAIGLENGTLDPSSQVPIDEWLIEGSVVRNWFPEGGTMDLRQAMARSANVYFAKKAADMGAELFLAGMDRFTMGTSLDIGFPMASGQVSNDGGFVDVAALAHTGYGQGELLATSLNVALDYSMLANEGRIMAPRLVLEEGFEPAVLKEAVSSPQNLAILQAATRAVLEDPEGTGTDAAIPGVVLAGKTGTAQTNREDVMNRWFVATTLEENRVPLSLAIMIEDGDGIQTSQVNQMVRQGIESRLR